MIARILLRDCVSIVKGLAVRLGGQARPIEGLQLVLRRRQLFASAVVVPDIVFLCHSSL